jgi:diguanylate cyclase (GGDEF)-like protein
MAPAVADSGIALVVPAYFMCAGILVFASITAGVMGFLRGRVPLYMAFAATCLFSAGITTSMGSYYLATTQAGGVEALRWATTFAIFMVAAIPVFVALYTDARDLRLWGAVGAVLAVMLLVANYVEPFGVRFDAVRGTGFVELPWGERLFRVDGTPGAWNYFFRACGLLMVAWAVVRLVAQHKKGDRREAAFLALYLTIVLASSLHGAALDRGMVGGFHSIGFALVGLAFLMGYNLMMRLREQNFEVRRRAYIDTLTGLPNRAFLLEHVGGDLAAGRGGYGGVLQCNLDHFKVLNDALTHSVGDELLREVARRLDECTRGQAVLARVGGDEFVAVLVKPAATETEASERIRLLAQRIARALAAPVRTGDQVLTVFASIGLGTYPGEPGDAAAVLGRADMALHEAKRLGRNTIFEFIPDLQARAESKYHIVKGLRRAIESNELALHYQPQLDLECNVVGVEALLRWKSPSLGDVTPGVFIPVAEESGLIHALGEWSLRRGCETLTAWQRQGLAFQGDLSVNVSPWQLARPEFVRELRRIIDASGIDPKRLTLEITESAVLYELSETVAKLNELRPLGVRIALDDFGTGYSSLALIKDLPLDVLKIDQSFVRHIEDGANEHLVRMVVAIGGEMGIDVVAEGVETERERERMVSLGCRLFQGYLFARPMDDAAFVRWMGAMTGSRPVPASP